MVRTFDTPGFRGMTFYEVQAKSIVSKVPASSMVVHLHHQSVPGMPACVQLLPEWGDADLDGGRHARPLADVRVGDSIYGTVRDGYYRRYAITKVLAHWSTVKPAYRVTLEDGTELVASGDHRFLTQRGWKHVTGAEQGPDQRPFLTTTTSSWASAASPSRRATPWLTAAATYAG